MAMLGNVEMTSYDYLTKRVLDQFEGKDMEEYVWELTRLKLTESVETYI